MIAAFEARDKRARIVFIQYTLRHGLEYRSIPSEAVAVGLCRTPQVLEQQSYSIPLDVSVCSFWISLPNDSVSKVDGGLFVVVSNLQDCDIHATVY